MESAIERGLGVERRMESGAKRADWTVENADWRVQRTVEWRVRSGEGRLECLRRVFCVSCSV